MNILSRPWVLSGLLSIFILCFTSTASAVQEIEYFDIDSPQALEQHTKENLKQLTDTTVLIPEKWNQALVYYFTEDSLIKASINTIDPTKVVASTLPKDFAVHTATLANNNIYGLAAGPSPALVRYDLEADSPAWETLAAAPFDINSSSTLVVSKGVAYVANQLGMHSLSLSESQWYQRAKPPEEFSHSVGIPVGNAHLLFLDKNKLRAPILAYHSITDSWVNMGELEVDGTIVSLSASGNDFTILSSDSLTEGRAILTATKYSIFDHLVVLILAGLLIFVGYYFSSKEKTSADYFKADSKIPWWAASLSIFATNSSAITLMAMPSMAFSSNWIYFSITIFLVSIQVPLFVYVFVPIVRRLNMATANQYLERRYGVSVRMLGFIGFSFNQILGRMAAVLLLPATAISAIFGIPMEYSILIMGASATIFVTMGGLAAVIWTDVIQAAIMIIAVVICAFFALSALEFPVSMATEILVDREKLKMFDFRLDLAAPVVIVLFLNSLATSLTYIGDQNFVQRVQCTSSEKEANKAVVSQLFVALPLNLILFSLGTVLFLYYLSRPEQLPPALSSDGILPYFAAQTLPAGLAGIVVVALLAATISTVSSALNSVANLGVDDIYRRFKPNVSDKTAVNLGRYLTAGLGIFGTGAALVLANVSSLQSLWDLFLMITGMLLSPITGIFILGVFTKKANIVGAWTGTVASIIVNYYAKFHLDVHAMVYLIIGVSSCVVVGYIASLLSKANSKDLAGLTIFTLSKRV